MAARRLTRNALVALALACTAALPAAAQPLPSTESALASRLEPGDRVTITDLDGATVRGRFVEVEEGILRLRQGDDVRRVPVETIGKVRRTRMGVQLGTVIGLGIGLGLGALAAGYGENEGMTAAGAFLWTTGISTAVGLSIDAAINLPRTVYRRDHAPRLTLAPIVGPRAAGVGVSVGF